MPGSYLVHPTVVDLRATSLFPTDLYNEAMGDVDRLLEQYQIASPGRPPNMNEKEAAAWDTLAMIDITNRRMAVTYMMLMRQFTIAGTSMCESLKQFNATSWKLYDIQVQVLAALAAEGFMVPAAPPYPTLFTNLSACAVHATPASPSNPGGVGIQTQADCAPGAGLGVIWVPIIIGVAIISYFGYRAVTAVSKNLRDVFVAKEVTRQAALESEFQMLRAAKIAALAEACAKRGGDPQKCLQTAYEGVPDELKALRNMPGDGEEERGLFFWLGVVATAAGAGALGYAFYRWRRKQRKRARQETVPA